MTDARHAKRIRRAAGALLEGRGRWRQELAPTGLVRRGRTQEMEAKEKRGEERRGKRRGGKKRGEKLSWGKERRQKLTHMCRKSETMAGWGAQKESKW